MESMMYAVTGASGHLGQLVVEALQTNTGEPGQLRV
jgi:uncharacterized protein YbjT (DUF2867 family)